MSLFEKLVREMEEVVDLFINDLPPEFNPKRKTGGVLVWTDLDGNVLGQSVIGKTNEKVKCSNTAKRKIKQLMDNPTHISSYLSRDPGNGCWGGGVHIFGKGLFAFSGLPELADEACLLKALDDCDLIGLKTIITDILAISKNNIFEKLVA